MHWSADMAFRLLQEVHLSRQASKGESYAGGSAWGAWLPWLPAEVATPLQFSDEEVAEIQYPDTVAEVDLMQRCLGACFEVRRSWRCCGCWRCCH
jgi:hypothetical protein